MINLCGHIVSGASLLGLFVTAPTTFVSAQYVQDHQHEYYDPNDYPISSQALTVLPYEVAEYAFVASFKPEEVLEHRYTRPLIVKLKGNLPASEAFDLDWRKTYYLSSEDEGNADPINLYPRDIHHFDYEDEELSGYIICGKVTKENDSQQEFDEGSFLLMVTLDGDFMKFVVYSIKELNSVVPTKGNNTPGFVAVGTTSEEDRDAAAYLSVGIDLSPTCHTVTEGLFKSSTDKPEMESTFKKIIQYGEDDFAMVGYSSIKDDCESRDTDILISLKTQKCKTKKSSHYGQPTMTDQQGNPIASMEEFGMSLSEKKPGKGKGLIVTGLVKETRYSCDASYLPTYQDGFIMRLKTNFKVKHFQRFDYNEKRDIGLAVTVTSGPTRVWISGETETSFFTSEKIFKQDIFLLEFKMNGKLIKSHLYAGPEDDGGLRPGNLDLESSQEGYPIILGNTKNFFTSQSAILIEHYRITEKRCNRKDKNPVLVQYKAYMDPNKDEERMIGAVKRELFSKDVDIQEKVLCEKK